MTDKIKCMICGNYYHQIGSSHLFKKHGIKCEEYKKLYNDSPFYSKKYIQNRSISVISKGTYKKENNPMYNRKNELHPFYGKTYEEIMGKEKAEEVIELRRKRLTEINHNIHSAISVEKATNKRKERYDNGLTVIWNKGLTKDNDQRISNFANKLSFIFSDGRRKGEKHPLYGTHYSKDRMKKYMEMRASDKFIKRYIEGCHTKPNKDELKLGLLLNDLYPNQFKYNGDYGLGVSFGGKIPDFWNVNGKKMVIELFGDYWHTKRINSRKCDETKRTKNRYKKCGVSCLTIWSSELRNKDKVSKKINEFVNLGG